MEQTSIKKLNAGSIVFGLLSLAVIVHMTADIVIKYQGIYLILFSLLYVLFPGLMMTFALGSDFIKRYKKWVPVIAFYAGFSLLIIQYYLLNLIGFLPAIKVVPIVIGIAFTALSWKTIKAIDIKKNAPKDLNKFVPFLVVLAAVMAFAYYYLKKTAPGTSSNLFMDYCYHMGNIEILTRGGNFEDIRVMGMTFKYHYFMELFYAIIRLIFPATIWNCVFRFPVLLVSPLVCGSFYNFIHSKAKNSIVSALFTALIILFPSVSPTATLLTNHILTNINAVGFSLPLAICLVEFIIRSGDKNEFKYVDLIPVFLLGMTLTGLKGPFAMALIAAMFIYIVYCALAKRDVLTNQLCIFLVLIVAFAILWFTLLNAAITGSNISNESTGLFRIFDFQVSVPQIFNREANTYDSAKGLLYIPISLIMSFSGAAFPFIVMVILLIAGFIRNKEIKQDYRLAMSIICAVTGIVFDYVLAVAQNRVYFFMFALPFVYICAAQFVRLIKDKNKTVKTIGIVFIAICSVFVVISVNNSFQKPFFDTPRGTLTRAEIDSIYWIKEHTSKDALFAINTDYPNGNPYYFSGMTERRFYLESYRYSQNSGKTINDLKGQAEINARMFHDESSPEICKELGVKYLVYFTDGLSTDILDKNYELVYSMEEVLIYSVSD